MFMSVTIIDNRRLLDAFRKQLSQADKEVVAGIQAGPVNDGLQVAEYAAWNEFGTRNIPARPFMRNYVDNNTDRLIRLMANGVTQIALGNSTTGSLLNSLGLEMQRGIKKSITSGDWAPNAEYTIKMKGGGKKPLMDTYTMFNSVTFAIRNAGETQS